MYTIKADNTLIYSPVFPDDLLVLVPTLTEEVNKQPTLKFRIPPNHRNRDAITPLSSVVTVHRGAELIFRGRAISAEDDFYKFRDVYCEGDIAALEDVVIRPETYNGQVSAVVSSIMTEYNARCSTGKEMTLGTVNVTGLVTDYEASYDTPWSVLTDLIKTFGGYIYLTYDAQENPILNYTKLSGSNGTQVIRFAKNLLDLTIEQNIEDFCTRIIPLGKETDGVKLTIASVNGGIDYLESSAAAQYGAIERVVEFPEEEVATALKVKGQTALDAVTQTLSVDVDAVDLELLGQAADGLKCGNYYQLVSEPHGMSGTRLQLSRAVLRLDDPTKSKYTFGAVKPRIVRR